MKKFALIVAGGSGNRMGTETPKQFILLDGKPILMHTIETFYDYDPEMGIVVVLPLTQIYAWRDLCISLSFEIPHRAISGGDTRFQSVKSGLQHIECEGIVFIHDGVRPFVGRQTIESCYRNASILGNTIPVVPVSESVRWYKDNSENSKPLDRNCIWLVQTPQTFKVSLIKKAYEQPYYEEFTDDASVFEKMGKPVFLTQGNRENIKITWPEDLALAEFFMSKRKNNAEY